MFFHILIVIIFFGFLLFTIKSKPQISITVFTGTIFNIVVSTFSLLFIEKGLYISELRINSYKTNSLFVFILYIFIFVLIFYNIRKEKKLELKKPEGFINKSVYKLLIPISVIILIYLLIDLFISGAPLITHSSLSKYKYFMYVSQLPLTSKFYSLIVYYFPIFYGVLFSTSEKNKKKKYCIIYIMCTIIYLFLIGYKVSGVKTVLFGFLIPIVFRSYLNGKIKFNFALLKKFLLIIFLMIFGILINYRILGDGSSASEQLSNRTFALTSHLWWITENYREKNSIKLEEIFSNLGYNLNSIIENKSVFDNKLGVVKIMFKFAPQDIAKYYVEHDTRMATGFITTHLYDYGYIFTIIFVVIFAIFYRYLIDNFCIALCSGNVVNIVIINKLLVYYQTFLWNSGTVTEFFNYENLILLFFLIFYNMMCKKYENDH